MDSSDSALGYVAGCCEHSSEPSDSMNFGEFF
jgi:hypothetical protein